MTKLSAPLSRSCAPSALAPLIALALVPCACAKGRPAAAADTVAAAADGMATGVSPAGARFVRNITGLEGPESVRYDPDQDVFFISNMAGYGSYKDGNGYIVRVSAENPGESEVLVQGGRNGATLDAPKGMAIQGDTLWVADIDVLRGFDRRDGRPVGSIDFAPLGVVLLNDVALAPDGTLRVTDTGIRMVEVGVIHTGPDRIFAVGANRAVTEVASGPQLRQPNGITWDAVGKRWIVVSFDRFVGEVAAMPAGGGDRRVLWTGKGQLDGVEVLPDGAIVFSSWADSSVHMLENGREQQLVRDVPAAADIGVDTRRRRLAIPLSSIGWVQLWSVDAVRKPPAQVTAVRR